MEGVKIRKSKDVKTGGIAVNFRITEARYQELCRVVETSGIPISAVVRNALYEKLDKVKEAAK